MYAAGREVWARRRESAFRCSLLSLFSQRFFWLPGQIVSVRRELLWILQDIRTGGEFPAAELPTSSVGRET